MYARVGLAALAAGMMMTSAAFAQATGGTRTPAPSRACAGECPEQRAEVMRDLAKARAELERLARTLSQRDTLDARQLAVVREQLIETLARIEQLEQQTAFDRNAYQPEQTTAATEPAATGVAPAPDSTAQAPAEQPAPETSAQAPAEPAPDATAEAPAEPVPDATAEAPAEPAPATTAEAPADSATDTTTTAAIDRSTLKEMPAAEIRAEEMIGTTVYGADDANVGEIGDIVLTSDGKIDAYVVDVGGFLGMGEKEVAIGSDNLAFMVDDQGNKYLYTTFTKEQLDAAPAYDKSTYTEKRDEQRILVQ